MIRGDYLPYSRITFKAELDKSLNILEGILTGIGIDRKFNFDELEELRQWCEAHEELSGTLPFSELLPLIQQSLEDDTLTEEENNDILWLCEKYKNDTRFFDILTADIQQLHGIMHGIIADNQITEEEVIGLRTWLYDNEHLTGRYPYDELSTLLMEILKDGIVTPEESNRLKCFFSEFVRPEEAYVIDIDEINELKKYITIGGICATCPTIEFQERTFCFTGASSKTTRNGFENIVTSLGGTFKNNVSSKTHYLVIGNEGNPCWAYSCYGRKVEAAVELRKDGHGLVIVHENDFWDAVDDL